MNIGVYTAEVEEAKSGLAEKKLDEAKPLVALRCSEGILLATPNSWSSFAKIREVYPGIVFGGIGEMAVVDKCFQSLVYASYYRELLYSADDVDTISMVRQIAEGLGTAFNDARFRPFIVNMVIASLKPSPMIFTVSYDGSMGEDKNFAILSSKVQQDALRRRLDSVFREGMSLEEAKKISTDLLIKPEESDLRMEMFILKEEA